MGYAWGSFHRHPDYRHKRRRSAMATERLRGALLDDADDERPLAPEAAARAHKARQRFLDGRRKRQNSGRVLEALTSVGLVILVLALIIAALAKLGWL